jgi:DNA-binding MarR family transcriptional regulator
MDAGYVSRNLKSLEKDQLIIKQKSAEDARSIYIRLTEQGKQVLEQLTAKSNEQIRALSRKLTFPQKEKVLQGMQTIKSLLENTYTDQSQISICTGLESADLGHLIYMHSSIYKQEYNYGLDFEAYVAESVCEFYKQYDEATNRIWHAVDEGKRWQVWL